MTGYLYDGKQTIAEFDCTGKVTTQYIHGPGLGADVGSMLCKETASGIQYYLYNWRGDVCEIINAQGTVTAQYRYDAFGNAIAGQQPQIGFSGKRYDSSVSLSYFGARYYDARLGRFISRDPMEFTDGPNDYIIATNNPLLWIDPWGESKRFVDTLNLGIDIYNLTNKAIHWQGGATYALNYAADVVGSVPAISIGTRANFCEKGEWYDVAAGERVSKLDPQLNDIIFSNGQANSLDDALNSAKFCKAKYLYYNPTDGGLADTVQSAWQFGLGSIVPGAGSLERGLADGLRAYNGKDVTLIFHSQGTITARNSFNILGSSFKFGNKSSVRMFSPAAWGGTIINASEKVGFNKNDLNSFYMYSRPKDLVPLCLSSPNPVNFSKGLYYAKELFYQHQFFNYGFDAEKSILLSLDYNVPGVKEARKLYDQRH